MILSRYALRETRSAKSTGLSAPKRMPSQSAVTFGIGQQPHRQTSEFPRYTSVMLRSAACDDVHTGRIKSVYSLNRPEFSHFIALVAAELVGDAK